MMNYLPFIVNAASPLALPFSQSPSTQEELIIRRIQMEVEINKTVALRQQQQINGLVKLIRTAQEERNEAKHKCLQILHLLLHRQNKLHLSTTDRCDPGNYLSFNQTGVPRSLSDLSRTISATDEVQSGKEMSSAHQISGFGTIAQSAGAFNKDQSIDRCTSFNFNNKHIDDGLASLLGFEIANEQEQQKQLNMDDVGSDKQHEQEITVDHLAMLFEDEPTQQFTKPCRVIPYSLQQPIHQSDPIPTLNYCLNRSRDQRPSIVVRAPLPQRGKLLQSVIEAGPLLRDLLLAGPLPEWKCPPPALNWQEIPMPPFFIPSLKATQPPPHTLSHKS